MAQKKITVMIAGGGTGGHIYPAIAIGRALHELNSDVDVRFVGTAEGLESKIMHREHLPLDLIASGKLNFSGQPFKKIKTLFKIPLGILQSIALILRYRPAFVLGVGGYASAPFVLAAVLCGQKVALWEPNAHPGMANRWLSYMIKRSYLVFSESKKYLHSRESKILGMPLRKEMEQAREQAKIIAQTNNSGQMTILCFGGSQGSVFLNEKISNFWIAHAHLHDKLRLIHQTGSRDFENIKNKYSGLTGHSREHLEVYEFIYDMPAYYRRADVQFCRGGASTIAEASAFGVLPMVVPLPAADNHQQKNAEILVKENAGFVFEQEGFKTEDFAATILKLLENPALRAEMAENLKKLAPQQAAREIAHDILKQI